MHDHEENVAWCERVLPDAIAVSIAQAEAAMLKFAEWYPSMDPPDESSAYKEAEAYTDIMNALSEITSDVDIVTGECYAAYEEAKEDG